MNKENINCIIVRLMHEQILKYNLKYSDVGHGICSESQMNEVMSYKYFPDKLIMDSLVQRLGLETEKYECIVSREEYDIIKYVDDIIDLLDQKDIDNAVRKTEVLNKKISEKNIVYRQLAEMIMCLCRLKDNNHKCDNLSLINKLESLLRMTIPEYKDVYTLIERRMSKLELTIYALIVIEKCKCDTERMDVEASINFLKQRIKDTCVEETLPILSRYAGAVGKYAYKKKMLVQATEISSQALELLQSYHRTYNIRQLLWIWINSTEDATKKKAVWIYEELQKLYSEFDVVEESLSWCIPYGGNEIYPIDEVVRTRRKALGFKQIDLALDICSNKTISNIENGKYSPQPVKKMRLLRRLGVNYCEYGTIETYDVELHKMVGKWDKALNEYDYETCEKMMDIFKKKLPCSKVNNQFLAMQKYANEIVRTYNGYIDGMTELINALEITCKVWDKNIPWIYSGNEINLMYSMADLLVTKGDWIKAKKMFQKLLNFYEMRDINSRHFIKGHSMIEAVYGSWYANKESFDEATRLSMNGVHKELKCGISHLTPMRLHDIGWNYENGYADENKKKESIRYLRYSYALSLIIQKNLVAHIERQGYAFLNDIISL